MSLSLVTRAYGGVLGRPVRFVEDCQGEGAKAAVATMSPGDVAILDNTRFHPGEEKNDPALAAAMAELGDFYVNDAFSAAHRAQIGRHTSELQSLMRISYAVFCL